MLQLQQVYLEHPPLRESSDKKILVMLHGYGSHEEDLFSMHHELDPRFHVISLRAPIPLGWGGFAWFGIDFLPTGISVNEEQAFHQLEHLKHSLRTIKAWFNGADLVLMGFSQGTIMSFGVALTEPTLVSAVIGFSGRLIETMIPKHPSEVLFSRIPVIQTHGISDPVIPVSSAREAASALNRLGFDHEYREYSFQHEISMNCLNDVNDWIQRKIFPDRNPV
ncbi:MAG: dienelactone hydrolase family protein [Bacteroidetes bacterium]|nr:dienelactone hydrolase family protein [Bacteroidota bacterium]